MELTDVNYKLPAIPQQWRGRVQLICDICYKHFNSKRNRRRHREAVHEGRKHVCEVCDKSSRKTRRKLHDGEKNMRVDFVIKDLARVVTYTAI